jgi:hypothetical protein
MTVNRSDASRRSGPERRPLRERFWPKVLVRTPEECWPWLGALYSNGYGHISAGGHSGPGLLAHRVAYELVLGPVPDGLDLDHLCRCRRCVNPVHLEPVTRSVNLKRGIGQGGDRRSPAWREKHESRKHRQLGREK